MNVKLLGLYELIRILDRHPREIYVSFREAGKTVFKNVIAPTRGIKYPPLSKQRRTIPYYKRGTGTQYARGRNDHKSERLGTKWYAKAQTQGGRFATYVGNVASYAPYVHGEKQARRMAGFGWRRLWDVVKEKTPEIVRVYQDFVNQVIRRYSR